MKNFFTVDFEFWHSWTYLKKLIKGDVEDQLIESTDPILRLLEKYNTNATFFTLGEVAEKYPEYVKSIEERGHEIACHGYSHSNLFELGKEKFEKELVKSTKILRKVAKKVIGYRACSFSLDQETKWLIGLLKKNGYKYDSSVFPMKVKIKGVPDAVYGVEGVPKKPYHINEDLSASDKGLMEFPIAKVGKIPVIGGFYHRAIPTAISIPLIKKLNKKGIPVNFWIHPQETFKRTPRIRKLPLASMFIRYHNIGNTIKKTEKLLKRFKFDSIGNELGNY